MNWPVIERKISRTVLRTVTLNSYGECAPFLASLPPIEQNRDPSWTGGTWDECKQMLRDGADATGFDGLVDQINTDLGAETDGVELAYAPAGGCVSVARHLAGNPMCMGRMVESCHEKAPIRVFLAGMLSSGIPRETADKRRAACVALVMALARVRPVELWYYTLWQMDGHKPDGLLLVRMGVSPLDMSAVAGMASLMFSRLFSFAATRYAATGNPAYNTCLPFSSIAEATAVGATPVDIVVPGLRMYDAAAAFDNPVAWVQDQLTKALAGTGLAHHEGY